MARATREDQAKRVERWQDNGLTPKEARALGVVLAGGVIARVPRELRAPMLLAWFTRLEADNAADLDAHLRRVVYRLASAHAPALPILSRALRNSHAVALACCCDTDEGRNPNTFAVGQNQPIVS